MHANYPAQFQNAGRAGTQGMWVQSNGTLAWFSGPPFLCFSLSCFLGLMLMLAMRQWPGCQIPRPFDACHRTHSTTRPSTPELWGTPDPPGAGLATLWPAKQFHQHSLGLLGANSGPSLPELPLHISTWPNDCGRGLSPSCFSPMGTKSES